MTSLRQLSCVGKEHLYPRKHMKRLRLYEAIGPARDAWIALSDKVTKYAGDHDEEITRGVKRPEGYSISYFMAGPKPTAVRPTIIISSPNKSERRAVKRVIESLEALAAYPDIVVECVDESIARLLADDDFPYDIQRNHDHKPYIERGPNLCGSRVVAGNSSATLSGVIYLHDGKTVTPFGLTVFHVGSGHDGHDVQPEEEMTEFAFDESSDEEEDEDLFENRSRSLSTSQTDADTDEPPTLSRTITEDGDLYPEPARDDLPLEPNLSPSDALEGNENEKKSDGHPPNRLDYQLVPLEWIDASGNVIQIPLQDPIEPKSVAKEAKDVAVWAATSNTNPVRGRLSICPYLLKLPTYSLQKLWVVDLERDIRLGDSGAWIVDESSTVYGHIVAAIPGSFRAYILPLHQIFEDIEASTKLKPSLLRFPEITVGSIPKNVNNVVYYEEEDELGGKIEERGYASREGEQLHKRNVQNVAQKREGTTIVDNSSKHSSDTSKSANKAEPASKIQTPQQVVRDKQASENKNADKITIRGRNKGIVHTVITVDRSVTSTDSEFSEADSETWESVGKVKDNETEATTVSGSSTAPSSRSTVPTKSINDRPSNMRTHRRRSRSRSRSPSRERRSVAFEESPRYYGPTTIPLPPPPRPIYNERTPLPNKDQERLRNAIPPPPAPHQAQYMPYGYPYYGVGYGQQVPLGYFNPEAPWVLGNNPFASTATGNYPPANNPPVFGTAPAPDIHHRGNLAGSRPATDNNQRPGTNYVPQSQQAPGIPMPPGVSMPQGMPGYPTDTFYSMARAFADSLYANTRQNYAQPIGQPVVQGAKDREMGYRNTATRDWVIVEEPRREFPISVDERRDLDAARKDLNDAWRDLDDARRDLDNLRYTNDYYDGYDRHSRIDINGNNVTLNIDSEDDIRRRPVYTEDDQRLRVEEDIRRLGAELRDLSREEARVEEALQEELRYLESRTRAPLESITTGIRDKRIYELERYLQLEREKVLHLQRTVKLTTQRESERDLKQAKEVEELRYEIRRLREQQPADTRPIDITVRRPTADSYDFNSARTSSSTLGVQPRNTEEQSLDSAYIRNNRITGPDMPQRRSTSLDRADRNRIAATPYNRDEDLDTYLRRPSRRGTFEDFDRSIPTRGYPRHDPRYFPPLAPASILEMRRREGSYIR